MRPSGLDFESFGTFVERGLRPAVACETRPLPAETGARMYRFKTDQPIPDPAVPEVVIHLLTGGEIHYAANFAFGRFEGLKTLGEFDVAPPGVRGSFEGTGPFELLSLSIPWSTVQRIGVNAGCEAIGDFGPLHSRMVFCPAIAELLVRLWTEATEDEPLGAQFCESALTTLVIRLMRLAGIVAKPAPAVPAKGGLAPWQVKRVVEFIEAGLAGDLSVAALAELCSLSPFHFARAFHQSLGKPPHAYVTDRRLERARRLLDETTQSICEIALDVGYAEPSHLARLFKRLHGVGPASYRRHR